MAVIEERITKNGNKVYRVKLRLKGLPPESKTFLRKTDARDWAITREAEKKKEQALGYSAASNKSVSELIDRYLRDELPKRANDKGKVRSQLNWWRAELGDVKLKELTPSRLAACRDKLLRLPSERNKGAKKRKDEKKLKGPATVARYMATLSHVLSIAEKEWEWLPSNPMRKVKRPRLPQSRARFLSDDERTKLLDMCQKSACKHLYPIVVLALSTGARKGEILQLRWQDVDLKRGMARLEQTKNGERRALPLTHHALELVRNRHKAEKPDAKDLLFGRDDGLAPVEFMKHWYKALEDAGVTDFRFHDLRHSAASYLAMNGATLAEIADVLGHKTLQMVKRYAHFSDQHTSKVVERMNKKIFGKK